MAALQFGVQTQRAAVQRISAMLSAAVLSHISNTSWPATPGFIRVAPPFPILHPAWTSDALATSPNTCGKLDLRCPEVSYIEDR